MLKHAPLNQAMAVDHLYPASRIVSRQGFNTLTREQMTYILQDRIDLGNLQPLPQSLNASKGAQLGWDNVGGKPLNADYVNNLFDLQRKIQTRIDDQIKIYQRINAGQ
jgi:hypothetical protein